jgi:hypothetical protein
VTELKACIASCAKAITTAATEEKQTYLLWCTPEQIVSHDVNAVLSQQRAPVASACSHLYYRRKVLDDAQRTSIWYRPGVLLTELFSGIAEHCPKLL